MHENGSGTSRPADQVGSNLEAGPLDCSTRHEARAGIGSSFASSGNASQRPSLTSRRLLRNHHLNPGDDKEKSTHSCCYEKASTARSATVPSVVMSMRVVFSCSVQERILCIANTMATRGTISYHLRRVIPTAVHLYKQSGWDGSTPGVALWRHSTRPRCHTVSIVGDDRTHLDTRRIVLGEQAEKPS
jgi:hypothetical protein